MMKPCTSLLYFHDLKLEIREKWQRFRGYSSCLKFHLVCFSLDIIRHHIQYIPGKSMSATSFSCFKTGSSVIFRRN